MHLYSNNKFHGSPLVFYLTVKLKFKTKIIMLVLLQKYIVIGPPLIICYFVIILLDTLKMVA